MPCCGIGALRAINSVIWLMLTFASLKWLEASKGGIVFNLTNGRGYTVADVTRSTSDWMARKSRGTRAELAIAQLRSVIFPELGNCLG